MLAPLTHYIDLKRRRPDAGAQDRPDFYQDTRSYPLSTKSGRDARSFLARRDSDWIGAEFLQLYAPQVQSR